MIRQSIGLVLFLVSAAALAQSADEAFGAIHAEEWAWRTAQSGLAQSGEAQPSRGRLDRIDAKHQAARLAYWQAILARLDALDHDALGRDARVNYAVYRAQIENFIAAQKFREWEMPFNSDSAFWSDFSYGFSRKKPRSEAEYRALLDQLAEIPAWFDQQIENMRAGLARGFSVPRAVLDGRDHSIAIEATRSDPVHSVYYAPFRELPPAIGAEAAQKIQGEALRRIRDEVIPAYRKLLAFFRDEYLAKARTTLAAEDLPDGEAWYRQQIRVYTTLDLDPETIHQTGLDEVARIHAGMVKTMHEARFDGDFAAFLEHLRTDPAYYAKSADELLARSAWIAKRVDGRIDHYIGHLPRARFTIEPVPEAIAPFYTSGRGGAGVYMVNTYDLPSRPLYNVPALTLHEAYPGHALQLQIARELTDQPPFRRMSYISAYGEGWGLYAESLGEEMGIYDTPYTRFGYLGYQMWRATRLVVDTGIHHYRWSRDKAIDYMLEHTALSRREIENEVDRYISWPGQALSYHIGFLKIRELRAKAEVALDDAFTLKNFNDTVLSMGSVPLPVLAERIDRFIAEGGKAPDWPCNCARAP